MLLLVAILCALKCLHLCQATKKKKELNKIECSRSFGWCVYDYLTANWFIETREFRLRCPLMIAHWFTFDDGASAVIDSISSIIRYLSAERCERHFVNRKKKSNPRFDWNWNGLLSNAIARRHYAAVHFHRSFSFSFHSFDLQLHSIQFTVSDFVRSDFCCNSISYFFLYLITDRIYEKLEEKRKKKLFCYSFFSIALPID